MTHLHKTLCLDIESLLPEDRLRLPALALLSGTPAHLSLGSSGWAMVALPPLQCPHAPAEVEMYCVQARRIGISERFTKAVLSAFAQDCQYLHLAPAEAMRVRQTMYLCVEHLLPEDRVRLPALATLPNAAAPAALTFDGALIDVPSRAEPLRSAFRQAQRLGFSVHYETLLRAVHNAGAHYVHLAREAPTLARLPVFLRRRPTPSGPRPRPN